MYNYFFFAKIPILRIVNTLVETSRFLWYKGKFFLYPDQLIIDLMYISVFLKVT